MILNNLLELAIIHEVNMIHAFMPSFFESKNPLIQNQKTTDNYRCILAMLHSKIQEPPEQEGLIENIFCEDDKVYQTYDLLSSLQSWSWIFHPQKIRDRQRLFLQDLDQICQQWKREDKEEDDEEHFNIEINSDDNQIRSDIQSLKTPGTIKKNGNNGQFSQ